MPIDLICHYTLHKGMELLKRIVSCNKKKKTLLLCKHSEKLKIHKKTPSNPELLGLYIDIIL